MTSKLKTDILETVSGSGTIALTNQLSGMTHASVPSGSVLQVVSYFTAAQTSLSNLGTTEDIVNSMTKVITPLGANSKFLVQVRWFGEINVQRNRVFNIHMDGTRVNINGSTGYWSGLSMGGLTNTATDNASTPEMMHLTTLVDTSSVVGTAITFSLVSSSNSTYIIWSNRCFSNISAAGGSNYENGTSELIITEIKG